MRIAVVIPTLDEAGRIAHAIESARSPGVDIIVADGGSRDATRAEAVAAGARVVEAEPGRARQLAAGVRAAQGADAFLFLHADTRLPLGWRDAVAAALGDPGVAGGAFAFRFAEPGLALRVVAWGARMRCALGGPPYGDQALFARTAALAAIGGVPQAPVMEDLDLVRALRRVGRLALLPLAAVTSGRRYLEQGVGRTVARHTLALVGYALGVDRARLAAWLRR